MKKSISSKSYADLRYWLKQARETAGLSMRDLGGIIDAPHSFIAKVENGERRLDVYEYVQYCEALSIDPSVGLKLLS